MDRLIPRLRAGWVVFCGLLPLFLAGNVHSEVMPAGTSVGTRRVLLIHGIYDSARSMRWMERFLAARGWQAVAVSLKPNDASVPMEVLARQVDTFVAANFPAGEKFDLVAFSMGGLVARYYIQKLGGFHRVRRFVTLSTPNHGTAWAWLSGRSGVKEMRPDSSFLRDLNSDLSTLAPLDYTSIYTPVDLTIIPAASSRMPHARNLVVWVPWHALMVMMPGPMHAVARALE